MSDATVGRGHKANGVYGTNGLDSAFRVSSELHMLPVGILSVHWTWAIYIIVDWQRIEVMCRKTFNFECICARNVRLADKFA